MKFIDFLEESFDGPIPRDEERRLARRSNLGLDREKRGRWTVWARTHAAARAVQRVPEITKEQWKKFTDKVIEKVNTFDRLTREKEFLFFSQGMNLGYAAAVDPKNNEIRIITILEPGRKAIRRPGTTWVQLA